MNKKIEEWCSVMRIDGHAESFDMIKLKRLVHSEYKHKDDFKEAFTFIIENSTFDRDAYEELTGIDFEDDSDVQEHLKAIYEYLYGNGRIADIDAVYRAATTPIDHSIAVDPSKEHP